MRIARLLLALSVSTLLAACASVPLWVEDQETEVSRGETRHKEILKHTPKHENDKLAPYVTRIGNEIAAVSDCPTLPWKFTLLDSPVENAFATMGGHVYVTRGLLAYLRNENELAAVLAHEIAHICRRDAIHAGRRANTGALVALGVIVAAPATLLFPQVVAAPIGMSLSAKSRSDEAAADQLGTTYLTRAGYPAEAMQDALDVIISVETYKKNSGDVRETFWHRVYAQHPETTRRQERLAALTGFQQTDTVATMDAEFLMLLDGMEVGDSVGEGILHEGRRYFPELAIRLEVPAGWRAYGFRGRNGSGPGLQLFHEKAGWIFIEKRPILDASENVCDAMVRTFESVALGQRTPIRSGYPNSCTALGSRDYNSLFSKRTVWWRVAIIRPDDEYDVAVTARIGARKENEDEFKAADEALIALVKSIEMVPADKAPDRPRLRIYRAKPGDTFEKLARNSSLPANTVQFLRAINVRSAEDTIAPGELIKVVK